MCREKMCCLEGYGGCTDCKGAEGLCNYNMICCGDAGTCSTTSKCCCLMSNTSIDSCKDCSDDKGCCMANGKCCCCITHCSCPPGTGYGIPLCAFCGAACGGDKAAKPDEKLAAPGEQQ